MSLVLLGIAEFTPIDDTKISRKKLYVVFVVWTFLLWLEISLPEYFFSAKLNSKEILPFMFTISKEFQTRN